MATGVVVYYCPDRKHISRYSDLRDCPTSPISLDLVAGGTRTKFLGSRRRVLSPDDPLIAELVETPEPEALDRKRLLGVGIAAFALVLFLLLITRRRKR
jgi:hypothetical protein